jgi:hypothetical protein
VPPRPIFKNAPAPALGYFAQLHRQVCVVRLILLDIYDGQVMVLCAIDGEILLQIAVGRRIVEHPYLSDLGTLL